MEGSGVGDSQDDWQAARLLPTVGLRNEQEKEQRATSSLLAVMFAVPEFTYGLTSELGAPKGQISTFTEVQLRDRENKRCIPDGAIIIKRGSRQWRCLVEVKTGQANLKVDQVSRYLDWARDNDFDAVLTISNEITAKATESPVSVDGRKLKKVSLFHFSWWRILTEAIVQHRHRGIDDPDQAWILGELIAYLDNDKSGASGFQGMGDQWVSVRTAAANGTIRKSDTGIQDVAERWGQFIDYMSMGLGQELGRGVTPVRPRKLTGDALLEQSAKQLVDDGILSAALKVPDAAGNLHVEADLRTKKVTTSIDVEAPREGWPKTRINWLLRQLKHADAELRIDVRFVNTRETASTMLAEAIEYPEVLLSPTDPKRDPRTFKIAMTRKMGSKRGKEEGSFARETRQQAIDFYRDVVQDLREWQAPAPKLPHPKDPAPLDQGEITDLPSV